MPARTIVGPRCRPAALLSVQGSARVSRAAVGLVVLGTCALALLPAAAGAQDAPGPVPAAPGSLAPTSGSLAPAEPGPPDTSLWSPARVAAWQRSLAVPMIPLAVLEAPRLGLRVAVFPGTDDVTLDRGAGHVEGSAPPGSDGNVAVAGHRDGYFRVLKDVTPGDRFRLVTADGAREYAVAATQVVAPEQVEVLAPTPQPALTLIACYPFYFVGHAPLRFVVRAYPVP